MTLADKTILVTGASRGVGAAIARACALEGARVLVHYSTNRTAAEAVAADLGAGADDLLQADLSLSGAGAELWRAALERSPRVHGLVNNAGIAEPAGIEDPASQWAKSWAHTLAVNVQAPADLCREALLHFEENGVGGIIVNIASRAAHRGDAPDHIHYAASKGAVVSMTKTIARGFAHKGVRAYAIAPGWVATDMAPQEPDEIARAKAEIPTGAFADPAEIGALAAFLLSDACPSATGSTFDVNGASYVR